MPALLRGYVLNCTLLGKRTNIRIGKRAPSDYLQDIQTEIGTQLDSVLQSHLIPAGPSSPLIADDFDTFIDKRLELVASEIRRRTT